MILEMGSEGSATWAIDPALGGPKEVWKYLCLRYMSMSPMGGFNVVGKE
jgi:hypothetical protein